ncbi:CapA family protein [Catenuloplanes atrovinosus]|uniref:Poly-gamma-glutamate synthesis protein (Capsule biosynthesis protein) n=1 Tax=Catenuloplanes atrovinosus TaxID=137266 RepID=A0AAE3YJS3_9ACTN|nr:CapA family protein [Catenuloplanes atrovinosus]MDR7274775.1 poly-gamma-glutamate synthesis protein (capsule biosynthesis protein) [Catenuloplanes atrovinosus]
MIRGWHRLVVLPVAVLCLATGCATDGGGGAATATSTPFLPVYVDESEAPRRPITLGFAGDVHFAGRSAPLLRNPPEAFGGLQEALADADVTVVNLKSAITTRGEGVRTEGNFRAPATAFAALEEAGVDAVSIASDHVLDFGPQGLTDTVAAATKAGFPVFGAGKDEAAAFRPWVTETPGGRVAVVALNTTPLFAESFAASGGNPGVASPADAKRAIAAVIDAKRSADVVVVYNQWGETDAQCPSPKQQAFASALAEAGASVIVGTGAAHTLQGAGWLGSAYVAYGLGDLIWFKDSPVSPDSGVLQLTVNDGAVTAASFTPARVSPATGQAEPLAGRAADEARARFDALRACAGLSAEPATASSPDAAPSR